MNMEWEVALIEWIQSYMGPIARILANVFSFIGGEKGLLILLLGTSFCWKKEVGKKLFLMIPSILAWNAMLKAIVMRPRPYFTYPDRVNAYVNPTTNDAAVNDVAAQGYSFPSMHSSTIPAGYFTLAKASRRKSMWIIAVIFTVLGGISRICAGVHYPTDVLAGWVIGFAVMYIFSLLEKNVCNEWTRHLIILATALPGMLFVRTEEYFTAIGILAGVILAFHYEEARVNYQDTRNGWTMAARMIGAFLIYFGVNTLLKLPFSAEFLSGGSIGALLIRSLRYMIITFLIIGIYPKLFPYFERLGPAHK